MCAPDVQQRSDKPVTPAIGCGSILNRMSPVTLLYEDHIVQVMMPLSLGRCVCVTSRYLMEHGVAFQRRTHELEETDTNNCVVSIGMV